MCQCVPVRLCRMCVRVLACVKLHYLCVWTVFLSHASSTPVCLHVRPDNSFYCPQRWLINNTQPWEQQLAVHTHTHKVEILAHCPQTMHWLLEADKESVVCLFQDTWNTHTSTTMTTTTSPIPTPSHKKKCLNTFTHTHTNLPIDPQSVMLYQPDSITVWCWGCFFFLSLQFLSHCITLATCSVLLLIYSCSSLY